MSAGKGRVVSIGNVPWTRAEMIAQLDAFLEVYENRPIRENAGGMKTPHLFSMWFMVRKLAPELIVESGIYKGLGTWFLEQACPSARIVSIDIDLSQRDYISQRVSYSSRDFSDHDWTDIPENSLVFIDDHQSAYRRIQQCRWFGFRHVIFEDNYPPLRGDCYSLKKAFAHSGYIPEKRGNSLKKVLSGLAHDAARVLDVNTPQYTGGEVAPNEADAKMLFRHLDVYQEFPPVIKVPVTRWGDVWDDQNYPTEEPLLEKPMNAAQEIFLGEAASYTWMCYARLSGSGVLHETGIVDAGGKQQS